MYSVNEYACLFAVRLFAGRLFAGHLFESRLFAGHLFESRLFANHYFYVCHISGRCVPHSHCKHS